MILRKKILLALLFSFYTAVRVQGRDIWTAINEIDDDDDDDNIEVYHNPCTGSITSEPVDDDACLEWIPETDDDNDYGQPIDPPGSYGGDGSDGGDGGELVSPSPPDGEPIEKIFCPGEDCSFDFESGGENVLIVQYLYAVETAPVALDPTSSLPLLEETLLTILAPQILQSCIQDGDIRMLQTNNDANNPYKRRYLNPRRRLAPTGICSAPDDEYLPEETCEPEIPTNNCYVIKGGVSVALDEGDSSDAVKGDVLDFVKDAMANDELLSDDAPDVEKVTFLGEYEDTETEDNDFGGGVVLATDPTAQLNEGGGNNMDGVIIGASFAALAALLIAFLIGRKKKDEEEEENPFGVTAFAGVRDGGSFTAADSKDLGGAASAMDVHHCKSQTCSKCYHTNKLQFLPVPKDDKGAFAQESCIEMEASGTRSSELNSSDFESDDSSVLTTDY